MSYTNDPANVLTDAVRLLVGDTGTTDILTDTEYQYFLDLTNNNVYAAAVLAARSIGGKYSNLADEKTGEVDIDYSQLSRNYFKLADQLAETMDSSALVQPLPVATGTSKSAMSQRDNNPDRVPDQFSIGGDGNNQSSIA